MMHYKYKNICILFLLIALINVNASHKFIKNKKIVKKPLSGIQKLSKLKKDIHFYMPKGVNAFYN